MKKFSYFVLAAAIMFLVVPTSVYALAMSNTGALVGIFDGNENNYDLESLLETYAETDYTDFSLSKVDAPATTTTEGPVEITLTYDTKVGDEWDWGTFTASSPLVGYTVKGGTQFALYYLNPAAISGIWATEHLLNGGGNIPELSHFIGGSAAPAPVPEPATMLLLGTGLVGLAGVRRKRFSKD